LPAEVRFESVKVSIVWNDGGTQSVLTMHSLGVCGREGSGTESCMQYPACATIALARTHAHTHQQKASGNEDAPRPNHQRAVKVLLGLALNDRPGGRHQRRHHSAHGGGVRWCSLLSAVISICEVRAVHS
jgi:hypothetical protein